MREIVLDTETTGLDPDRGDRLVEIGAVELMNQVATGKTFHVVLNPECDVSEEAFRVHGHSTDSLKDSPVFAKIAGDFLDFIRDDKLVIHNAEFDVRFLNTALRGAGHPEIRPERVTDTLALARRKHPGAPNGLDALCDRYRIDRSRRTMHGALLDAKILVEVYTELTGGRQKALTLSIEAEAPRSTKHTSNLRNRPVPLAPRSIGSERLAHIAHIALLGEPAMWNRYVDQLSRPRA